jgi:hypothetical protein
MDRSVSDALRDDLWIPLVANATEQNRSEFCCFCLSVFRRFYRQMTVIEAKCVNWVEKAFETYDSNTPSLAVLCCELCGELRRANISMEKFEEMILLRVLRVISRIASPTVLHFWKFSSHQIGFVVQSCLSLLRVRPTLEQCLADWFTDDWIRLGRVKSWLK